MGFEQLHMAIYFSFNLQLSKFGFLELVVEKNSKIYRLEDKTGILFCRDNIRYFFGPFCFHLDFPK